MSKNLKVTDKTSKDLSKFTLQELASQFDSMSKEDLLQVVNAHLLPLVDPEKYKAMIKANMPEFVREMENKEDAANSIYESGQEFLLVMIDCLKRYHKWSDEEVRKLHKEITEVLMGVKEFEDSGLSILSPHSVGVVGDKVEEMGITRLLAEITRIRFEKAKYIKSGIEYSNQIEGSRLNTSLTKPRK